MAELIGCRSCDSPNCKGCNVYILDQALSSGRLNGLKDGNNTIRIPTAGVRPVVKGNWIMHDFVVFSDNRHTGSVECPVCGRFLPAIENFCPRCGTDMRGDWNGV